MKKIFALIIAIAIPLIVGGVSAGLTSKGMEIYGGMNKPPLSPPAWLFPVAWTILYIMMGIASYLVYASTSEQGNKVFALGLYAMQLVMNFMWSIIFFSWGTYLLAFVWLIIMWIIVIICAIGFGRIESAAGYLMVPYILWLTFAAYLNMGAYILNRD